MQNDAILHRLVHTKILSGSLDPELDLTPAQRRKALAGRVLEATGKVKLGKGENVVRSKEHNKAAKHIRDGRKAVGGLNSGHVLNFRSRSVETGSLML